MNEPVSKKLCNANGSRETLPLTRQIHVYQVLQNNRKWGLTLGVVIPNLGAVSVVPNWALGVLGRVSGGVNVPVTNADCATCTDGGVWGMG